ncbi:nose resistant to fluoxetine protein 6 [Caerostris extrusa]|uniref:Nose resistant to fluoxetine protein 6 n=1 Tax=Caerostris extrusa TaxID=172846 RepID=A0AAV4QIP2_CAEEX|nr:nose resistant to fluoxetine protein 6 [Caerostris extrusa]
MHLACLKVLFFLVLFCASARLESTDDTCTDGNVTEIVEDETTVATEAPKQTFKEAEKEITDFINSLLRQILPKVVGGSGDAKLTPQCTAGMMKIFGYVRRMKGWTIKFHSISKIQDHPRKEPLQTSLNVYTNVEKSAQGVCRFKCLSLGRLSIPFAVRVLIDHFAVTKSVLDSMGKPSAGILKGTSYSMGDYDECLDLTVTSKGMETDVPEDEMFRGKYCRVKIRFPEVVIETAVNYHQGLVNASDLGKLKDIIQVIPYIPVKSNYMNHFIGLCFPSICTTEDLEQLVTLIPFPGKATLDRCEVKTDTEIDETQLL